MGRLTAIALAAALALVAGSSPLDAATSAGARICRKGFTVNGRTYAQKRLDLLLACSDKFLKCELMKEIDGLDPASCRASVADACTRRIGAAPDSSLSKAALRFELKIGGYCQSDAYAYPDVVSTGPGGLWFGTDPACAAEVDLPSFLVCLRGELEARVDGLVSILKPRTALLFDNAGLGAGFPTLVRPPLVDQVVAATAPGSGTLVAPGTIAVAVGSGLRFTGDAATLSCNGSDNNGRVTVTVGSGPTAKSLVLREPFTADVAIFGPFVAPASVPYTIEFKDGSCQDFASGTVDVS